MTNFSNQRTVVREREPSIVESLRRLGPPSLTENDVVDIVKVVFVVGRCKRKRDFTTVSVVCSFCQRWFTRPSRSRNGVVVPILMKLFRAP